MAVPFSNTKLRVPKGFQNILEGLAREVLRNQPENIFEFGAKYFDQLLRVRDETGHDPAVHGARMEDRFYNNDAFRSPGVDSGDPQQQDAALKIQTEYRRHSAKKEVEGMREEDAATTIQAGVRGHQDRQKVDEMKETEERLKSQEEVDINLDDPEVAAAAVKIQAGFKGYKARKEVKETKSKTSEDSAEEATQGETTVTKQEPEEANDDQADLDPNANEAATKIQAGYRGHKVRQEVKARRESQQLTTEKKPEEIDIDLEDPEVQKAATKIQAGFRGHKTRKEMKGTKETSSGEEAGVSDTGEITQEISHKTITIDKKLDRAEQELPVGLTEIADEASEQKTDEVNSEQKTEEVLEQKTDEKINEDKEQNSDEKVEDTQVEKKSEEKVDENKLEQTSQEIAQETVEQAQSEEKIDVSDAPAEKTREEKSEENVDESPSTQTQQQAEQSSPDEPKSDETEKGEPEKIDIDLNDPDVVNAATKIQAGFKGYKTRKDMKEPKDSAPTQTEEKTVEKQEEDVDIDLDDPETAQAALKIQAGFRGYKTRKEVKENLQTEGKPSEETPQTEGETKTEQKEEAKQEETKPEEVKQETQQESVDIDLNDPDVAKAATKIQAGFKGYKVRKDMKKEGEETTTKDAPKSEEAPTEQAQTEQAPTEQAQTEQAPSEQAPTEQAPAPTEEAPKEEKGKKLIDLPLEDSQRIMEALSAFKTFKKPEKLPDRLKLSRNHMKRILKWYKTSKEKINEGTFTGMQQAAYETQRTFSGFGKNIGFFDSDEEQDESSDEEDFDDASFLGDMLGKSGESLEGFEKGIENFFGQMFGGLAGSLTEDGNISKSEVNNSVGGLLTNMTDKASTMVQPMMKLFNKDTYYKPVLAAIDSLEKWIEQSKNILEEEQIEKLQKQLQLYIDTKELLDQEQDDDEPYEKEARGAKVMEWSREIEAIGPLPQVVQNAMNEASGPVDMADKIPSMMNDMTSVLTEGMSDIFTGGPSATGQSDDMCTIL